MGTPIRLPVDFSAESSQASRDIFKVLKERKRPIFKHEDERMSFPDKQKLRECIASRPALQKCLGVIHAHTHTHTHTGILFTL